MAKITIGVEISDHDGNSIIKVEESLESDGTLGELSGIFHQVHNLAERIRDGQAGLQRGPNPGPRL